MRLSAALFCLYYGIHLTMCRYSKSITTISKYKLKRPTATNASFEKKHQAYANIAEDFMLKIYNDLQLGESFTISPGQGGMAPGVNTVRSVIPTEDSKGDRRLQRFIMPGIALNEVIHQIQLRFDNMPKSRILIIIKKNGLRIRKFLLVQKLLPGRNHSVFVVTKQLSSWFENLQNQNVTVDVIARSRGNEAWNAVFIMFSRDIDFSSKFHAYLQKTNANNSSHDKPVDRRRQKRATRRSNKHRVSNATRRRRRNCQVKDFEVDFTKIGWGQWIVFPKKFNAKMCQGRCPPPIDADLTPTNHALLQSLMRVGNRKKGPPMPCCVPTELKPLSMLYYEGKQIVVRHHEDMIVEKCGCR